MLLLEGYFSKTMTGKPDSPHLLTLSQKTKGLWLSEDIGYIPVYYSMTEFVIGVHMFCKTTISASVSLLKECSQYKYGKTSRT